jgi:hypothetical protein
MATKAMQKDPQELAATYRNLSDAEIADLYVQIDTLTDAARSALEAEIQRRGLSSAHMSKMHAAELRHEALFDGLQKQRRKNLAWYFLTRNDPKGMIVVIIAGLVFILILVLVARRH